MPPFRIAARHPDRDHVDHAWFQIGGLYDTAEEAQAHIDEDALPSAPESRPVEERPVRGPAAQTSERAELGYEIRVESLEESAHGTDDAGGTIVTEHKWKAVS